MAANTNPIFILSPSVQFNNLGTNAETSTDGTGPNVKLIFTGDATNGSKIERVIVRHLGTNSTASTIRFFVNNGSTVGTAANNSLVHEETLAASTISQTAASTPITWYADLVLPAGYKLYAASGTALAQDAKVTAIGGHY